MQNQFQDDVVHEGAQTPLDNVTDGEFEVVKGNKFAISGGIYKNQTKFTSIRLVVKINESI